MTRYQLTVRGGSVLKLDGQPPGETSSQVAHDVSIPVYVAPEHEWLMDHLLRIWNQTSARRD